MPFFNLWIKIIGIWIAIGLLPFALSALRVITKKSPRPSKISNFERRWLSFCGAVIAALTLVKIGSRLPKGVIDVLSFLTNIFSFTLVCLAALVIIAPSNTEPDDDLAHVNGALVAILGINFCTLCLWLGGHYA